MELKWLGEELGRVRDADVLLELLEAKAEELEPDHRPDAGDLIERLRAMRERDRDLLLEAMRSERYTTLLDRLVDAANAPRLRAGQGGRKARKVADSLVQRPWRRLRKQVKKLPEAPADVELHTVRKRVKQARYALEAVRPVTGRASERAATRFADLQDVLGDHQDAVVASQWLESAAKDSSGTVVFVAGELAGLFRSDRRDRRREWRKVWRRAHRSAP